SRVIVSFQPWSPLLRPLEAQTVGIPRRSGRFCTIKLTSLVSMSIVRSTQVAGGYPMSLEPDLYFISVAARMLGMHPQTLRKYERLGLVQPSRTVGSMRLYSRDELERLRMIKHLVDDVGVNLAGVQRLLSIAGLVERVRPLVRSEPLSARDARRIAHQFDELARMLGFD